MTWGEYIISNFLFRSELQKIIRPLTLER